jgi:hypothetical protein
MKIFRTDQERLKRLTDRKVSKSRGSVLDDGLALGTISKRLRDVSHSSNLIDREQVLTNSDQRATFPHNS